MKKVIAAIVALMLLVCGCTAAFAERKTVTKEEAIKTCLDYYDLTEEQVTFTKVKLDHDDGRKVWEVEFIYNGLEYEFDVDVLTGEITDIDIDHGWDDD